ncbi:MAG: carboxylating nicotinate-nucleotide diphosphorylase [Gammaproteobacteria bacterium]|nr:carboxylating nicotinate-nucleotide diphosphorylase [Gammaproteobacteria bacterium]
MTTISQQDIFNQVKSALAEDLGTGDVTASLIPADQTVAAKIIAREQAVLCGTSWVNAVFSQLDSSIQIKWEAEDTDTIQADQVLCTITGPARAILSGERTALNFLQTLSGTASATQRYVDEIKGTNCKILDTRKTIPNLRLAQKYAVTCGGGLNHRIGLYDAILIKENHILAAGSITQAVKTAQNDFPDLLLEVEVETLDELREAIQAGARRALLDNMNIETLKQAVSINKGQLELEASGGISFDNLRKIAETGVDYISIGSLTKHLHAIDLSMRFNPQ